jgi:hypothetical protein
MSVGVIVGIGMIATGVLLLGVVVWKSLAYRQAQRNLEAHLGD